MNATRYIRRTLLPALLALAVLVLCAGTAGAGVNRWTNLGPRSEATVTALAADPSSPGVFYAATQGGGVFRSEDGGETWKSANAGLDDGYVTALAADPSTPGAVYAADAVAGVYKSTDGGDTWHPAGDGLAGVFVSSLVIDSVHPSRMYAGGSGGVFRTTDGAGHWAQVLAGSGVIALAKSMTSTVYAMLYQEGGPRLYRSDDAGDHWSLVLTASFYPIALCVDPFDSGTLYAVNNSRVVKSTDGGLIWKPTGSGLVNVQTIALSPADSKTIVAGTWDGRAFASSDSGATWQQLAGLPPAANGIRLLLVASGTPPTVLAARGPSLLKGTSAANDPWHLVSQGLEAVSVSTVAVSPLNASALLASDGFGPLRSVDSGQSWSRPDSAGATVFYSFARSPSGAADLAGTDVGVLRSEDGGASWQQTTLDGTLHTFVNTISFQPGSPQTVYSAAYDGIRKSRDSGKTWILTKTGQPPAYSVLADRVGSQVLYATYALTLSDFYYYGFDELTVEKSTDDGRTWTEADAGLPQDKYLKGPGVSALVMDPSNSLTLYAGTQNNGVYKSTDGATTWAAANYGIETLSVSSIVADPSHPATLYLASASGIYRSDDGALSWFPFNDGLGNLAVSALSIDATGHHLFASTGGGGIYEREIQPPSSCQDDENHSCYLRRFLVSASAAPPLGNLAPLPVPVRQGERFGSFRLVTDDTRPSDIFLKFVDGRALPGHAFWIFHAGLTQDSYALTVTDTSTGLSRVYTNGPMRLGCGGIDTYAFPDAGAGGAAGDRGSALSAGSGDTLLLAGGRFRVVLSATDPRTERTAKGLAMPQDDRDGYFSLPDFTGDPAFPEVFVRVSEHFDGSLTLDHTGLTDLAYEMTVTDSATGAVTALRNQTTDGLHPCGGSVALGQ